MLIQDFLAASVLQITRPDLQSHENDRIGLEERCLNGLDFTDLDSAT